MDRKSQGKDAINAAMELLHRRWMLRVVWELRDGGLTFRALQAACGDLSPTVLNQRLAELRESGLLASDDTGYRLTPLGLDLIEAFQPLSKWAVRWKRRQVPGLNPDAHLLWQRPRWALAFMLACLSMLGPFSIDTFIPAFSGIAESLGATPVQMQQTLSAYLFGFALMNLFHGALSDSFGRRPVVLWGMGVFALASVGCALSQSIGWLVFFRAVQGTSAGAGVVVSRAIIRDMFPPNEAQRVMSQVTIYFGIAPAIAPMVGGFLFVHVGWHAIFWFLALVGGVLWLSNFTSLPETLHVTQKQPIHFKHLMAGYWQLGSSRSFLLLALASGVPFNGVFLYVLSAPVFLGDHLHLAPQHFFWLFLLTISGIMGGAWLSGRLAGHIKPRHQIRHGFLIMLSVSVVNLVLNLVFKPEAWWALLPIGIFAFGWALMVPVVTLLVLDLFPERRGMASSLQACIGSLANAFVAGVISPLVMHSTIALATASLLMMSIGIVAWIVVKPHIKA